MARLSIVGQDFPARSEDTRGSVNAKESAGYVEVRAFTGERYGYSCGTCVMLYDVHDVHGATGACSVGACSGLEAKYRVSLVPVATYGCCNNWKLAPRKDWLTYGGR